MLIAHLSKTMSFLERIEDQMGLLINRLLTILNEKEVNSIHYHIALILLLNYERITDCSIDQIANLCTVSKSTISKFARLIGFDDYSALRAAAPFKENKFHFDLNYNTNILSNLQENGHNQYFRAIINDMNWLEEHIDMQAIDHVARLLHQYQKVAAFGLLFSETAAIDLQYKLAYNKKFIVTFQNDVKQDNFIKNADENTLIILFSNSGTYINTYALQNRTLNKNIIKKSHAKFVLITSNAKANSFEYIDQCIVFNHQTTMQTHTWIYPIVTDLITLRYREMAEK